MASSLLDLVPQTDNIANIYASHDNPDESNSAGVVGPDTQARWSRLLAQFISLYNHPPDWVARSPGRVNIIGEHIDYNLYDVLPTAISVDVLVAVKAVASGDPEARVTIANVSPERFPSRLFAVPRDTNVEINPAKHEWVNYFKAGLLGALKFLRQRQKSIAFAPASLEVLVDGNVPPGGGISSSAAFVCASALAVLKAHHHDVSKQDLLDLAVVSERAVGVYSGGFALYLHVVVKRNH